MGGYTYEDAQLDGFQERVRVDLKKGFSSILRKYRDGESDLIRQIYFTAVRCSINSQFIYFDVIRIKF